METNRYRLSSKLPLFLILAITISSNFARADEKRFHLDGEISIPDQKLPVTAHFEVEYENGKPRSLLGFYYYEKTLKPIRIIGKREGDSPNIAVEEFEGGNPTGGTWAIQIKEGSVEGNWKPSRGALGTIKLQPRKKIDTQQLIHMQLDRIGRKVKPLRIDMIQKDGEISSFIIVDPSHPTKALQALNDYEQELKTDFFEMSNHIDWWSTDKDYDGDGYKDIAVRTELRIHNDTNYAIWLYDPQKSNFSNLKIEGYGGESLCNPEPDLKIKKQFTVGCVTGGAGRYSRSARFTISDFTARPIEIESKEPAEDEESYIYRKMRIVGKSSSSQEVCNCIIGQEDDTIKSCSVKKEHCIP